MKDEAEKSALAVRWLIALTAFLCLATSVWADTPVTLFESFAGNVNFVGTEKTLRTQPNTADPCAISTGTTTATLSGIPTTATIRKAYLYWAGSGSNDYTVTFDTTALTATRQYTATWSGNNFFSGVVDVTTQVTAKRNNSYSLSNLTVNSGYTYCGNETVLGGWALLVIYEDASQPFRVLNLYEGFQAYQYNSITLSLSNFQIPTPLGTATGRHGHITWEGDTTLSGGGESLVFNGYELTDATNPSGNQFNSASNITSPVDTASYGVDFDAYTIGSPTIAAGQTTATTVYSSGQDLVFLSAEIIAVPNVPVADLALAMSLSGSLIQGQTASYVLTASNNGPVSEAGPITITDTLPGGLTYVSGSGTGWSCSAAGQTVTCTHAGPLAVGANLDTLSLTVAVSSSVTGSLTNSAYVGGTLFDNVAGNDTAAVSSTVVEQHCTTSNVGTDVLVTCTGNGFLTIPSDTTSVRYLVVGGGGGGGGIGNDDEQGAGGGGAGGVLRGASLTVTPGAAYNVTVGSGGTAGSGSVNGGNGGSSSFATVTALGGGGGAREGGITGVSGGSGGGGSGDGTGGSGTAGQGNGGGAGDGSGTQGGAGGGGGAAAVGASGSGTSGGNGGSGISDDITGTSTYYGGGGGGGRYGSGTAGSGGLGGGGSAPNARGAGTAGTPNTGGGGGGASGSGSGSAYGGGLGGSGIVLVRYAGPRLTIANASLTEGNAGSTNMSFTVTLSRAASSTVTVAYTLSNGTATGGASCTSGVDFVNTGGTLTFNPGVTTQTISVPICGDTTYEADETFTVALSAPVNAVLGSPSSATGTILNDDTPALIAEYRFDETSWNGTSGEVKDSSGNAYNATRGGSATTATATPAYTSGSQSTCYYGVFNQSGTPSSYVQLPSGFPSLSTDFTISAWVRTTNIGKIGQRIVVRDDNNDGWALSLSDATAGTIRVFNRSISYTSGTLSGGGAISSGNVALDTPVVIGNNNWYFVAAVVNLSSKTVTIYVYNTAGTQLAKTSASFTGTWNVGTGATAIGSETSASLENGLYFSGNIDEVRIYNGALTQSLVEGILPTTRVCSCTLGSFRITQDSTALACPDTRAAVLVEPMCVDGTTVKNDYSGTVALGTNPAGGTFYDAQVGGTVISGVTFIIGNLSKPAYLYYPNETSVCVTASEGAVSSTSANCTSFHAYGFRVTQQPADGACGSGTTIQLTAYGKNETGAGCSTITGFTGGKGLKAWFTTGIDTDNPATAQASNRTLSITSGSNTYGISDTSAPTAANLSSVTFTNGVATLTASYPNAAKIFGINFKHDASPYNGTTCGATAPFCPLTAVTGAFLAYPNFALAVTDSGSACAAGDATCSLFKAAGDSFNMKLQALCADGSTLATDYKNGSSPIPLAVNALVAPSGGQTGSVGTTTTNITSGGEQAFTQSWSEVGVATFKATPPVWFGHSFSAATTGNIGRFNPKSFGLSNGFIGNRADFATTGSVAAGSAALTVASAAGFAVGESISIPGAGASGAVLNSLIAAIAGNVFTLATAASTTVSNVPVLHASAFTYMDEPFLAYFTLTAINAAGTKTQNYTGAFARLSGATASTWTTYSTNGSTAALGLGAVSGATALTARLGNIAGQSGSFSNGVGNFSAQMTLNRAAAPDGPYTTSVGVAPQDTDGVHLRAADIILNADPPDTTAERGLIGTLTDRFGRLWLGNVYGSELRGLAVPYETQFWNGFAFVRNADDGLTPFAANNISLATTLATLPTVTLANLAAGAGTITLGTPSGQGTVDVYVNLGSANGNCPGYAAGTAAARTYLSGKWCGNNYDRDPVARATFGIQAGRRGPIYIRESY